MQTDILRYIDTNVLMHCYHHQFNVQDDTNALIIALDSASNSTREKQRLATGGKKLPEIIAYRAEKFIIFFYFCEVLQAFQ